MNLCFILCGFCIAAFPYFPGLIAMFTGIKIWAGRSPAGSLSCSQPEPIDAHEKPNPYDVDLVPAGLAVDER